MTPRQVQLVRDSWALIEPLRDRASRLFYERLFESAPALRPMFTSDISAQGTKLFATLNVVVDHIDHLVPLLPPLRQLAVRHLDWDVLPEHYDQVGIALANTLAASLGEAFTPEVRQAWEEAYGVLAAAMKEAAYPVTPNRD
jgi:nitric oxide dioxygenase